MKCFSDAMLLSKYLEKDLTPQQINEIDAHLEHCLSCQKEIARLQMAMAIMKEAEEVVTPRNYSDIVRTYSKKRA